MKPAQLFSASTPMKWFDQPVVCINQQSPLSSVAFHKNVDCIQRLFAVDFPMHLAIHRISDAEPMIRSYTELHAHEQPEINIIIPDASGLEYLIQVGEATHRITESTSIWIPPSVPHSANVVSGSGYFIALRVNHVPAG